MCGDKGEITNHEPQTKCQKLLVRIQALVFCGLSVFTVISLINNLNQVSRTDLQLTDQPPSDRCVPFFDKVKQFKEDTSNTYALYDYRNGDAVTRLCSNASAATIRATIGAQYSYDPWLADTGCDVLGVDKQRFIDNCEISNNQPGDPTTCADILNITPLPYGAHWNWYAQLIGPNKTNATYNGPAPRCSIKVTRISSISACNQPTMEPMHDLNENVAGLIKFGIAIPFIVLILQCVALHFYVKSDWKDSNGWMLAFACRGIPGGFYMFFWVCKEGEEGRGEFPDVFLNFWGWFACLVSDAMEGLVVPAVAVLGCHLERYPLNLALLILKAIKILYDTVNYLMKRHEESEPGGQADQQRCWAESAARMNKQQPSSSSAQPHIFQGQGQASYPQNGV